MDEHGHRHELDQDITDLILIMTAANLLGLYSAFLAWRAIFLRSSLTPMLTVLGVAVCRGIVQHRKLMKNRTITVLLFLQTGSISKRNGQKTGTFSEKKTGGKRAEIQNSWKKRAFSATRPQQGPESLTGLVHCWEVIPARQPWRE